MSERTVKIVLAYDGTGFCGWQRQAEERSVQGELEKALERVAKRPVAVTGAGRTDSGVHARGQAATFILPGSSLPVERVPLALNSLLPPDVRVLSAAQVPAGFNARFDARWRTYRYFIRPGRAPLPFERLYAWQLRSFPDVARLNRMAAALRGETDFTAFCVPRDKSLSRWRFVRDAAFFTEGAFLVFEITANAFLWRMVRSIVGTLIDYDARGLEPDTLAALIASGKRADSGPTAPACGLFLWNVEYPRACESVISGV